MSKYSGKCDVYDHFSDRSDEYLKNSKFYIHGSDEREHRLKIENQYDLMPYYPFLIGSGGFGSEGCSAFISSDSFVDREEQEHLGWRVRDVVKIYNRCKRNKTPFDIEEVYKEVNFFNSTDHALKEIIKRVAENGAKANIDSIHLPMQEYYRTELYRDMVEAGYDEIFAYRWAFKEQMYFDNSEPKTRLYDYKKSTL